MHDRHELCRPYVETQNFAFDCTLDVVAVHEQKWEQELASQAALAASLEMQQE